jgi:hypothetical protein
MDGVDEMDGMDEMDRMDRQSQPERNGRQRTEEIEASAAPGVFCLADDPVEKRAADSQARRLPQAKELPDCFSWCSM